MKSNQMSQMIALVSVVALVIAFLLTQTSLGTFIVQSPWWVYAVLAGVFVSGYMWLKTMREENEVEQESIEQEGQVYMERLEEARGKKARQE
ncbi:sporulation YhaL family protein [Shouchella lonarensis]|uniref:Sporulation protein YhaL n=1 Tax=Shouchella lonarensis TaxID=1464122 RepID=A0A1G6JUZ0_9BACI|nr:sporulation YhaL family protein [Shouchella lonarensis]SDC22560.1 Sporulation protein YhaL [Shouchella lonarensis]